MSDWLDSAAAKNGPAADALEIVNAGEAPDVFGNKGGKAQSYYTMAHLSDMNTRLSAVSTLKEDELLGLELRIAKRADEIAQTGATGMDRDVECWLQAERDVFAGGQPGQRRAS